MKSKLAIYDHKKIEKKWQKKWEKDGLYKAKDPLTRSGQVKKPKYYCLIEFPYPSGDGLHVGHIRSNTAMDIIARKRRMEGYNVLYPIGWDAFGLPTENYAIKTGIHPTVITKENTDTFRRQLKEGGFSFDWEREVNTTDPEYYKWTQWIFLQMLKKGLAYKKKMPINWCISCKIGLANEEVLDNHCERCGGMTDKREKEQWMLAITKYADRLDKDLNLVDYMPKIKTQQRNWIGRSEGAEIEFSVIRQNSTLLAHGQEGNSQTRSDSDLLSIKVFTTRPDTIFGATYLVLAPDHEIIKNLKLPIRSEKIQNFDEVDRYAVLAKKKTEIERTAEGKEKTGVELRGIKAINPATKKEIPIFVADYVLSHYGTGAIMAVPAHDERDFEFAKKFKLPIVPVVLREMKDSLSYVMGVSEEDIKQLGAHIINKIDRGDFVVEIPRERLELYKKFIRRNMKPGFWNEFSTPGGFYFMFKHKDGRLEEMMLSEKTNDIIDSYGEIFNDREAPKTPRNVYSWIAENSFYKKLLIHSEQGCLINSGRFDGMSSEEAKSKITEFVGGKLKTTYKLRDWVFSRQRYWGEPIPVVICDSCALRDPSGQGVVPIPEKDLPVKLPNIKNYKPTETGESPLASVKKWVNVKCPKCKFPAKRETDTMPNWAGSSWYYLSYCFGIKNLKLKIKKSGLAEFEKNFKTWLPVDWYNGGMEHTTLHLLYSRFWHKFLFDIGHVPTPEPYQKRTSHGLVLAEGGVKMSKSKGNVINPDSIVHTLGADTLRVYEMFMGPFGEPIAWNSDSVAGSRRFLERVWRAFSKIAEGGQITNESVSILLHQTVKKVTEDIEEMKFNTCISAFMILLNEFEKMETIPREYFETYLILLSPFAPHITEELWAMLGNTKSIHLSPWPKYKLQHSIGAKIKIVIQVNSKVRDIIEVQADMDEGTLKNLVLERPNVKRWINEQTVKRTIVVKNKLVNIVT